MHCEYVAQTDGTWLCPNCGDVAKRVTNRVCSKPAPAIPPLRKRLLNFTAAAIGHAIAGFPSCTDDQIQERLTICRACEHFIPDQKKPDIGGCSQCGCPASDRLPKFVSKLAWADQECPVGKWPKI